MYFQLLFNSIVSGLLLGVVSVGFDLIFNTTKVFHLAHGVFYVMGAYVLIATTKYFGQNNVLHFLLPIAAVIIVVTIFSILTEWLVYRPLSKKNAGQGITLISSLAVYIFLVNMTALIFTNENKYITLSIGESISWQRIVIIPIQIVELITSIFLLTGLIFLSKTKLFLQIRAVMSQETVASVIGVNSKKIRMIAMILGSAFAATGGILKFYDSGINPYSGMNITLGAAAAVIIGGNSSLKGTIIASLLIAFLQTITEWFLSSQWKEGMTFLLLIIVLLWKTEGIISFKMRVEEK